jgi:energy-converting hydrogenase Eha subunit C
MWDWYIFYIPALIVKGIIMAALIIAVAGADFTDAVIVAICSATVNGIMLLLVSYIHDKRTVQKVDEVKAKVEEVQERVPTDG